MLSSSDGLIARGQAPTGNHLHGASAAAGVARERPQFAVIQVTRRIFAAGHDACIEHAPGRTHYEYPNQDRHDLARGALDHDRAGLWRLELSERGAATAGDDLAGLAVRSAQLARRH